MEKRRVLANGPLSFDKALLVMVSPLITDQLCDLNFSFAEFWIQVSNILCHCMSKGMGDCVGSMIGVVLEVDTDESDGTGPVMRIRVVLDISRPLMRGFIVSRMSGDPIWCPIQYEKLLNYCFFCGIIGHLSNECPNPQNDGVENAQYGSWLKAQTPGWKDDSDRDNVVDNARTTRERGQGRGRGRSARTGWDHDVDGSRSDQPQWRQPLPLELLPDEGYARKRIMELKRTDGNNTHDKLADMAVAFEN